MKARRLRLDPVCGIATSFSRRVGLIRQERADHEKHDGLPREKTRTWGEVRSHFGEPDRNQYANDAADEQEPAERINRINVAGFLNRTCAYGARLDSTLLADPPQDLFSTAIGHQHAFAVLGQSRSSRFIRKR